MFPPVPTVALASIRGIYLQHPKSTVGFRVALPCAAPHAQPLAARRAARPPMSGGLDAATLAMQDQDVLERELEELLRFNETLMRENELFESHLQRTAAHLLQEEDAAARARAKKQPKRSQQALLTAEQKYDIAVQEMEEIREEITQQKMESEQLLDTLRARMEVRHSARVAAQPSAAPSAAASAATTATAAAAQRAGSQA